MEGEREGWREREDGRRVGKMWKGWNRLREEEKGEIKVV